MADDDNAPLVATFQANYDNLLRFLTRRLGDVERAADVAQDTYVQLVAASPSGEGIRNPRAYVYRVAGNLAIDTLRRDGRLGARRADIQSGLALADPAPSQDATILARERLGLLDAALGELAPNARLALLLFRVEGLPHVLIARRLGVSESMVAKYIAQALRHCRDRLRQAERD